MMEFLFSTVWGWLSMTTIVVLVAALVFWLVPSQRWPALVTALGAIFMAIVYTKGSRDRAALEARRKEEAVRRAREAYDKIDKRPDTPDDVEKRMKDGTF